MVTIRLEEWTNGHIEQAEDDGYDDPEDDAGEAFEDDGDAEVESDAGDVHKISRVPVLNEFLELRGSKFQVAEVTHHLNASPAATVAVVRLGYRSGAAADVA